MFSVYLQPWKNCQYLMIVPLHTSILVFRSQETPIDGQPPALPPKQFKKNSWNQIHHSHSQQELDNHINETFDVPASPEKSTVSSLIQLNHSAFLSEWWSYFTWAGFWSISELLCLCITLQHFCYPYCPFTGSYWFYSSCWGSALSVDNKSLHWDPDILSISFSAHAEIST